MPAPKVSVIVPVYNVSEYLPECLDSLINQTLKDIEIICVNDASTDNSLEILRNYAEKDDRIVVIDMPENRRQGGARNAGIAVAHGEYLGFVDSDDWVDKEMYETLYRTASEGHHDIVTSDYWTDTIHLKANYTKNNSSEKLSLPQNERNKYLILGGIRIVPNIYKHDFWNRVGLKFPEKLVYEDNSIGPVIPLFAESIGKCNQAFYHVRSSNPSTTRSKNKPHFWDRLETSKLLRENLKRFGFEDAYHDECEFVFIQLYLVNTLFGSITGFYPPYCKASALMSEAFKTANEWFPNYRANKYYKKLPAQTRAALRIANKSYLLSYIIFKLYWQLSGVKQMRLRPFKKK